MEPTCRLSDKNKRLRWKKQTDAPWSAGPHVHQDLMSNIIVLLGSIRVKMNANEMENGEGSGAYHRGLWQTRVGSSEAPENSNWLQHRVGGLFTQVQWWPRSNAGRCNGPCSDAGVCVLILKMLKSEKRLQIEISSVPLSQKKSPKISAIFPEIDGFWAYLSKELTAQTMKSLSKKGDERLLAFASFCTLSLSLCLAVESAILSCDVLWQQIWKRPYSLPYILSVRLQ